MTALLLDTNICVEIIRGKNSAVLRRFQRSIQQENRLILSSIVEFELAFGVANSPSEHRDRNSRKLAIFLGYPFERMPFESQDAVRASTIRSDLKRAGTPIGAYDLLLAGQAIRNECTIVTDNTEEFSRVKGLRLTNWMR